MFIWMLYIQICVYDIYIYVWFSSQFTPLLVSDLNYSLLIFLMGFKQLICVYILLIFKWQLYCAVQNGFQFVLLQLELQKGVPSLYLDYVVLSHLFFTPPHRGVRWRAGNLSLYRAYPVPCYIKKNVILPVVCMCLPSSPSVSPHLFVIYPRAQVCIW